MESLKPRVSIVIPTYNRSQELQATLASLEAQRLAADEFEVIVADDGSSDGTGAVVRSFEPRMRLRYHHQDDRGARVAAARNAGARLASAPVLVFMDTGTLAGPEFLDAHLELHADTTGDGAAPHAVVGYTYGYRPFDPTPGLAEAVATLAPNEVRQRYGDSPSFQDCRHPEFASADFDLDALPLPWIMFWAVNISVGADEFWRAGGFDESFQGWGVEDLDLGLRLHKRGVQLKLGLEAWAIETPHERDPAGNADSVTHNALQLLEKFPEPATEVNWAWFATGEWLIQDNSAALHERYHRLLEWIRQARDRHVDDEIDAAVRDLPVGTRVAVFGCGTSLPRALPADTVLIDFDADVIAELDGDPARSLHHALGVRTVLWDDSVDLVVVTSLLQGLWEEFGTQILAETHRVGKVVHHYGQAPSTAAG